MNFKILVFFFILIFASNYLYAQVSETKKLENLEYKLLIFKEDPKIDSIIKSSISNNDFEFNLTYKYLRARLLKRRSLLFLSERDFFSLLEEAKSSNNKLFEALALRNIGDIYNISEKPKQSIYYYKLAIDIFSHIEEIEEEILTFNNIGVAYYRLNDFKKAQKFYSYCLYKARESKLLRLEGLSLNNLANLNEINGDYTNAIVLYKLGIEKLSKLKTDRFNELNLGYAGLAKSYLGLNDEINAEKYAKKSLNYPSNYQGFAKSIEVLIASNLSFKNYSRAFYYSDTLRKKIENQVKNENESRLKDAKASYDLKLSEEKLLQEEINKKNTRYFLLFLGFLAFSLILILLYFRRLNKLLKNQNIIIESLNQNLETKVEIRTEELSQANKELVLKNFEITEALFKGQTIERKRVAAELHDNLGSTLSALKWRLGALDSNNLNEKERTIYESIKGMMSNAYEDVRNISHNLLPAEFETKGLVGALQKYIHDLNENGKIKFIFKTEGDLSQIDKKVGLELYSISMELITNILKHSGANEAEVYLASSKGKLQLEIKDNGKGLDLDAKQGKGLVQINERVSGLGGEIKVLNESGKGVGFRMEFSNA